MLTLDTLPRRISLILTVLLGVLALGMVAFINHHVSAQMRSQLLDKVTFHARSSAQLMALPLWDFNQAQLELSLRTMLTNHDLVRVRVYDYHGTDIHLESAATASAATDHTMEVPIVLQGADNRRVIGLLEVVYSVQKINSQLAAFNAKLIGVALLALIVVTGIISWLLNRSLKPVEMLTSRIIDFKAAQIDAVAPDTATREVRNLIRATAFMRDSYQHYNEVLEKTVAERTHELEQYRDHLEQMVEAQVKDIRQAKEEAEAASRAKSEFLTNMSHELRTPMHAVLNYSKMGIEKLPANPNTAYEKYFTNINASATRLLRLINDLLDLAKMEAGHMEFNFERKPLDETLQPVMDELAALLKQKGLQFHISRQTPHLTVPHDTLRMAQVFTNILSNAIRFTNEGGTIEVMFSEGVYRGEAALRIAVDDEGVGIPENELESVFDKFVQGSKTKTGAGGTGLGLSISRIIMDAHHGDIHAERGKRGGACIVVSLPYESPVPQKQIPA